MDTHKLAGGAPHPDYKLNERAFGLPDHYKSLIDNGLARDGFSTGRPGELAKAVLRLSDFYKDHPQKQTPWHESWARAAYLAYFFPLNYVRAAAVIAEGLRSRFFSGIHTWSDFGSGCGTVACAAADAGILKQTSAVMIERAQAAINLHKHLQPDGSGQAFLDLSFRQSAPPEKISGKGHLAAFSYSLTELTHIPAFAEDSDAFLIIEPATRDDGRRLLGWRQTFIDRGYAVHAPCTHQMKCPLLHESERDWCHDRIEFRAPEWFLAMEKHLPIKNRTLTFSYLLVRRSAATELPASCGRLTGDLMKAKGASRQMFCRGERREFLSWQHKHGKPPHFPRGILVSYPNDIATKSNELRPMPGDIVPI